jgi:chromosomal replication initiation ATPase DnaA
MLFAFSHAYNLGRSNWEGGLNKAMDDFLDEYESNTVTELTPKAVIEAISYVTSVDEQDMMMSTGRWANRVFARNLISWFLYNYTNAILSDIQELIGYATHPSVIHSIDDVSICIKTNPRKRQVIDSIKIRLIEKGYRLVPPLKKHRKEYKVELV